MLNHVFVEGFVTTQWQYANNIYLKLAVYHDASLPAPEYIGGKEVPEYVTAYIPNGHKKGIEIKEKQQIRIEGYLQSNDYTESLADFLGRSNWKEPGAPTVEVIGGTTKDITAPRSTMIIQITKYDLVWKRNEEKQAVGEDAPARKPDLKPAPKQSVSAETAGKKPKK